MIEKESLSNNEIHPPQSSLHSKDDLFLKKKANSLCPRCQIVVGIRKKQENTIIVSFYWKLLSGVPMYTHNEYDLKTSQLFTK